MKSCLTRNRKWWEIRSDLGRDRRERFLRVDNAERYTGGNGGGHYDQNSDIVVQQPFPGAGRDLGNLYASCRRHRRSLLAIADVHRSFQSQHLQFAIDLACYELALRSGGNGDG